MVPSYTGATESPEFDVPERGILVGHCARQVSPMPGPPKRIPGAAVGPPFAGNSGRCPSKRGGIFWFLGPPRAPGVV